MNKQEYIEKIKNSGLNPEVKSEILGLLEANDLTYDIAEEIKDILQADIDALFTKAGISVNANDPEIIEADKTLDEGLAKVQTDLEEDIAFVEKEMADLEVMVKELDSSVDQSQIDQIKEKIG